MSPLSREAHAPTSRMDIDHPDDTSPSLGMPVISPMVLGGGGGDNDVQFVDRPCHGDRGW